MASFPQIQLFLLPSSRCSNIAEGTSAALNVQQFRKGKDPVLTPEIIKRKTERERSWTLFIILLIAFF